MRSIQKTISQHNDWKKCTFYLVELDYNRINLALAWLKDEYGPPRYSITWWNTFNSVWMRDDIYTHYKLCE